MRSVTVSRTGGPEELQLLDGSATPPDPGPGHVIVEVEAAGVAYADVLMRRGLYPEQPELPFTPGYDVVGRVAAVGAGADRFAVGDRVASLTVTGGYATHARVAGDMTVTVPDSLAAERVAALTLNYVTAYQMLHRIAAVKDGASILVYGAAGGVGSALTELARLRDITVFGTASGSRLAQVEAAGAVPIDRTAESVPQRVRAETRGGVAATFDAVGGPHLREACSATDPRGRVVSYGISFAVDRGLDHRTAMRRHVLSLAGCAVTPGARVALYAIAGKRGYNRRHPERFRQDLTSVVDLLAAGRINPQVSTLPLERAADAHRSLESGEVTGKLVLIVG